MRKSIAAFLLAAFAAFAVDAQAQVTMSWSYVGNPGNAADFTGLGAVPHAYDIAKYDVTASQYVQFLNSKDPTGANTLGLYFENMSIPSDFGEINVNDAAPNGMKYSVIAGDANFPVNNVSCYNAMRFANWMNNGQGNGDTETGAYTLLGGTPIPSNGSSVTRNAGATVFLPSLDEWYKAAYYNPVGRAYFLYPTSSNSPPTASAPTALPNSANFEDIVGGLTAVGAYSGTTSPYGAFDMGGNVWQWDDTKGDFDLRGLGGGQFLDTSAVGLASSVSVTENNGWVTDDRAGFRLAIVPEPSTLALAALGFLALAAWRLRRTRVA